MLSRSTACRSAARVAHKQAVRPAQRRGLAAPASGSFQYQSGDAQGVKFASRDFAGPTTTLALVAKAGTRYQPLPGLTEGLQNFAFRVRQCIVGQLWGAPLTSNGTLEHGKKVDPAHHPRV
jgi:ubiquinol-cytochrome c reductase core subunit 2